jgi:uncharacterized membrane protein
MILIWNVISWVSGIILIIFFWLSSINLTKSYYSNKRHVWEEDPQARLLSNISIALMLLISFLLGYING